MASKKLQYANLEESGPYGLVLEPFWIVAVGSVCTNRAGSLWLSEGTSSLIYNDYLHTMYPYVY